MTAPGDVAGGMWLVTTVVDVELSELAPPPLLHAVNVTSTAAMPMFLTAACLRRALRQAIRPTGATVPVTRTACAELWTAALTSWWP